MEKKRGKVELNNEDKLRINIFLKDYLEEIE